MFYNRITAWNCDVQKSQFETAAYQSQTVATSYDLAPDQA